MSKAIKWVTRALVAAAFIAAGVAAVQHDASAASPPASEELVTSVPEELQATPNACAGPCASSIQCRARCGPDASCVPDFIGTGKHCIIGDGLAPH